MKTLTMLALAAMTAAVTDTPAGARDIIPDTCTYTNPILHADYSDPDAIRVGGDYWMTASSTCQACRSCIRPTWCTGR